MTSLPLRSDGKVLWSTLAIRAFGSGRIPSRALFGAPDALPLLTPNWDKYYLDLSVPGSRFERRSLPLDSVYMLCERQDNETSPCTTGITAREGLIDLIANTYANNLLDPGMRAPRVQVVEPTRSQRASAACGAACGPDELVPAVRGDPGGPSSPVSCHDSRVASLSESRSRARNGWMC